MMKRAIGAASMAFALAGCDSGSSAPAATTPIDAPTPVAAETSPAPTPNYVEHRNGVYYYESGVSENDRANGVAAGTVQGFRYLGRNEDGDFVVVSANMPGLKATCADPCRIIHISDGENVGYEPTSIIGGVFTDAMNGMFDTPKGGELARSGL